MRFKEFYLKEASQEYNIAKVLAEKIIKTMKDMSYVAHYDKNNSERFKKYKLAHINEYRFPMSEFMKDMKIQEGGVLEYLKKGRVFFEEGEYNSDDITPWLYVRTDKGKVKAGGYFSPNKYELGIHLPFIDSKTGKPFQFMFSEFKSLIIHELTHFIQNSKEDFVNGTANLSQEEWYNNKKERESYLHELYNDLQNYVKDILKEMKYYRSSEYDTPNYKMYVNFSNSLYKMFEDVNSFKKTVRMDIEKIFLDNLKNKNKFLYLSTEHRDIYNKFLEDSFEELKKEFKPVIPTKRLKYEGKK